MSNLPYEGVIVRDSDFVELDAQGAIKGYGGLIATYTGETINPLDPDPERIHIADIAHALSNSCRFTGHVKEFYSVAQHSVLVSQLVPQELALVGLLHDASEAYLSDISRPVKAQPEFGDVYKRFERQLEEAIAIAFGLPFPWPDEIKKADTILLRTEQRDLMPPVFRHEGEDYLPYTITGWEPRRAETEFLDTYWKLV